jgi:branched-chain amino acid transport system substrate-binding protein
VPKNAQEHVANQDEVAVMGTYNSGCAKIEVRSSTRTRTARC